MHSIAASKADTTKQDKTMRLLGNADGINPYHDAGCTVATQKAKLPKTIDPIQYAYRALILRHNELQMTIGMATTEDERLRMKHFMQAYEEAIETVDQYRKCE